MRHAPKVASSGPEDAKPKVAASAPVDSGSSDWLAILSIVGVICVVCVLIARQSVHAAWRVPKGSDALSVSSDATLQSTTPQTDVPVLRGATLAKLKQLQQESRRRAFQCPAAVATQKKVPWRPTIDNLTVALERVAEHNMARQPRIFLVSENVFHFLFDSLG